MRQFIHYSPYTLATYSVYGTHCHNQPSHEDTLRNTKGIDGLEAFTERCGCALSNEGESETCILDEKYICQLGPDIFGRKLQGGWHIQGRRTTRRNPLTGGYTVQVHHRNQERIC